MSWRHGDALLRRVIGASVAPAGAIISADAEGIDINIFVNTGSALIGTTEMELRDVPGPVAGSVGFASLRCRGGGAARGLWLWLEAEGVPSAAPRSDSPLPT